MKTLVLSIVLLLAVPALAQESWTVQAGAADVTRYNKEATRTNAATCSRFNLAAGCSQIAARNAFCSQLGSSGPAPCTVNGESSATVKIYADGRDWFERFGMKMLRDQLRDKHKATDAELFATQWAGWSAAERDAWCLAHGQEAGCGP